MDDTKINNSVVMIESPYSGDIDRNIRYLNIAITESKLLYGECPYAGHAYLTQHARNKDHFCSNSNKKWSVLGRDVSVERCNIIRHRCDKTVFYTDRGWNTGMKLAKEYCEKNNLPYEERQVNVDKLSSELPILSSDFCLAVINDKPYEELLL